MDLFFVMDLLKALFGEASAYSSCVEQSQKDPAGLRMRFFFCELKIRSHSYDKLLLKTTKYCKVHILFAHPNMCCSKISRMPTHSSLFPVLFKAGWFNANWLATTSMALLPTWKLQMIEDRNIFKKNDIQYLLWIYHFYELKCCYT